MAQQIMYYDRDCLMCTWYTRTMVKHGILDKQGRQCYQEAVTLAETDAGQGPDIDLNRARNEIALLDTEKGTVHYGLHSFFVLFGKQLPILRPLFDSKWFITLARPLYRLISYNRKVISPPLRFEEAGSCTPDFKIGWRLAYIFIATLMTGLILTGYANLLAPLIGQAEIGREFLICGGQVIVQALILRLTANERILHYLGNMVTISMVGALGLTPVLLLSAFIDLPIALICGHFFFVVWLMFKEHIRRVKYLQLPAYLTLTWVLYRLFILIPML